MAAIAILTDFLILRRFKKIIYSPLDLISIRFTSGLLPMNSFFVLLTLSFSFPFLSIKYLQESVFKLVVFGGHCDSVTDLQRD